MVSLHPILEVTIRVTECVPAVLYKVVTNGCALEVAGEPPGILQSHTVTGSPGAAPVELSVMVEREPRQGGLLVNAATGCGNTRTGNLIEAVQPLLVVTVNVAVYVPAVA